VNICNFNKTYKATEVIQNVNIEFTKGKVNFILGKNGSGNTTLFKCILGLENFN